MNVIKLHRYEYAGLNLEGISEGEYRKINLNEIKILKSDFE